MNKIELINATRTYLGRPNLPSADISFMIQIVEGELNRALREHPRSMQLAPIVQLAGNALLPLPADILQAVTLRTATQDYKPYPPTARAAATRLGEAFIARGNVFEVFPTPAVDTTFYLDYIGALPPLVNDLDTNWVSSYFGDVYFYGVLKESAVYLKDDPRLVTWQAEFTRRTEELIAQGWGQNITTTQKVHMV